ncbi:bifunctional phosphoribosylaminoimidazolecarboxamide formyltransferase/IMP cyclohydrolase [Dethiobacter alkaliphilus]|uniref:bifunctional phosphoribosylaminoimidazolecarboxamide formyltransferase/IMP cyclohydrolase n=1 Tax=Dethiobacter alkaliphilus TaxID=427926 RepID=UPI002225D8C2|nr:bifunctional phosphoribosylaminoimidazolecarboxamide formyltransferase/IMP cyclohydrolase [Dethiobacter alkaliphilus]MCW3490042.1 bifunctional phosphoribosylaminoimidazolecarboxamide formyltransferase/IMP cyclohydrolase [Dethiobacter alkaliphilus]
MTKLALLSVSDKTGLVDFAKGLVEQGFTIISTGGTKKALADADVPVKSVSDITGFPEILDGRVKTLHPKVHGGILARRDLNEHLEQMQEHGIGSIELVAVNLYPFAQTVAKPDATLEQAIENIDIGGPTMVRSAAKNFKHVAIVVNPGRYDDVLAEMREKGSLSDDTRFKLAVEAFSHTAEYDAMISGWLYKQIPDAPLFPETLALPYSKVQDLRYGENPQQKAAFYREANAAPGTVASAKQLHGKAMSFNNINDLNAAWELVQEFSEPAAVAVKHANPCGVAVANNVYDAYALAFEADPVSIFGGIVALNRTLDAKTAEKMSEIFLEVVIAPDYDEDALAVLTKKKDIRVLQAPLPEVREKLDVKKVSGGILVQELDDETVHSAGWGAVTNEKPSLQQIQDMIFGMKVVKHVKSNAIVLVKNGQTIGIGAGQMNRVGAARIAIEQAGDKAKGSVLASDAFFPFRDTVDEAAKAGVKGIVQPGGSMKDQESTQACDEHRIAMMMTGTRYFKH